jgi:hypothetical protein
MAAAVANAVCDTVITSSPDPISKDFNVNASFIGNYRELSETIVNHCELSETLGNALQLSEHICNHKIMLYALVLSKHKWSAHGCLYCSFQIASDIL